MIRYAVLPTYRNEFKITVREVLPNGLSKSYWELSSDGRQWKRIISSGTGKFRWYFVDDLITAQSEAIIQGASTCKFLRCDLTALYPELFL